MDVFDFYEEQKGSTNGSGHYFWPDPEISCLVTKASISLFLKVGLVDGTRTPFLSPCLDTTCLVAFPGKTLSIGTFYGCAWKGALFSLILRPPLVYSLAQISICDKLSFPANGLTFPKASTAWELGSQRKPHLSSHTPQPQGTKIAHLRQDVPMRLFPQLWKL